MRPNIRLNNETQGPRNNRTRKAMFQNLTPTANQECEMHGQQHDLCYNFCDCDCLNEDAELTLFLKGEEQKWITLLKMTTLHYQNSGIIGLTGNKRRINCIPTYYVDN